MLNIAKNTFKEIVRNRFLYLILFFAFVFILFSLVLGQLTIGESEKVVTDFGLGMIEVFGLIWVLFVGSQLLFKEIEGKTIFLILSKPIARWEFILGKFFGFSGAILLIIVFQACLYLGVLFLSGVEVQPLILWALLFSYLKLEVLLAIVFFFSTFMSHIITIMASLMIYLISHSYSLILDLFGKLESSVSLFVVKWIQLLLPPLEALNVKNLIWVQVSFELSYFLYNIAFVVLYTACIITLSVLIFSHKTFED